jgi:hypothetical protein
MNSSFNFPKNQTTLFQAYSEINWLLDKGYPKKSIINFVGNHHKCSKKIRFILNRATQAILDVENINRKKITDPKQLEGLTFHIDLYNQYISYQSLLDNDPLIICRDGICRDIFSVIHSKNQLRFDIDLFSSYILGLEFLKPRFLLLYVDQQRSNSRKHSQIINKVLSDNLISGECLISKSVDYTLKNQTEGVILSHDSIVLGKSIASFDYLLWYIKNGNLRKRSTTHLINFNEINNSNIFR